MLGPFRGHEGHFELRNGVLFFLDKLTSTFENLLMQ